MGYLGFKATTIHGDREQEQREMALNDFKSGRVNFMVATNVAARGLDIPLVDNVINIDMPGDMESEAQGDVVTLARLLASLMKSRTSVWHRDWLLNSKKPIRNAQNG